MYKRPPQLNKKITKNKNKKTRNCNKLTRDNLFCSKAFHDEQNKNFRELLDKMHMTYTFHARVCHR